MAMSVGKAYLLLYNIAQTLGWTAILVKIIAHFCIQGFQISPTVFGSLYAEVGSLLKIFQTLAVLEVFHAAVGLVRSNSILTALQVSSRVFVLWCVLEYSQQARESIAFPILLIAWTMSEVIRYAFYSAGLLNCNVWLLTWLRYSMFIVLYPIGITGELLAVYNALPKVAAEHSLTSKNNINWVWYAYVGAMLSFVPVFPQLYGHMLSQRKKVLQTSETGSAKKRESKSN